MVAVASTPRFREVVRDPVLLLPVVVAAGLGIGWIGVDAHVARTRIAVDLLLAWSFVVASITASERPRWRRTSRLLAVTGFALLAADLVWSRSQAASTLGFVLAALWLAVLLHVVLSFPEGAAWSLGAQATIVGAYAVALGGQLIGVLAGADPHDVLSLGRRPAVVHAVDRTQAIAGLAVAVLAFGLVVHRLRFLRTSARRVQGPLLVAGAVVTTTAIAWLLLSIASPAYAATLRTAARAVALAIPIGVIAGMLWSRLAGTVTQDLVVEVGTGAPTTLRGRLAKALGDPTLDVAYRLEGGGYIDASGLVVDVEQILDRAVTPLLASGNQIAVLIHDPALLDEPTLVESVQATAGLVIENERLAATVRSQLAEVRQSRGRIVAATDAERRRIERDLHDGAQQRLVTLSLALAREASRVDLPAAEVLARAQDEVEYAIAELRELARGIHPTLLRSEGLRAAVEALARRTPLPVLVGGTGGDRPGERVELAAYYVVAEALTNVVKHASANKASVFIERGIDTIQVSIADDGDGGARIVAGSGLAGLRDRLQALDGELVVESIRGRGTTIRAELPCES